jgi:hypothetical protein
VACDDVITNRIPAGGRLQGLEIAQELRRHSNPIQLGEQIAFS